MSLPRVTIVGLGLMGGSLALALRQAGSVAHISGCGRQELLDRARQRGAIDSGSTDAGEAVAASDVVVLCTPVETSITLLRQIAPYLKPGAVVTDVGSTKQEFADAAREVFGPQAAERVLPGHPMAGLEVSGLENASADLYAGCLWILTPLTGSTEASLTPAQRAFTAMLRPMGVQVVFTDPATHDRTLAYTSHLPQLLSTVLALTLRHKFAATDPALQLHAKGLLSMLRLASSDPRMWEQIVASNRQNIAQALESLEGELRELRGSLAGDEFAAKFKEARAFAESMKRD